MRKVMKLTILIMIQIKLLQKREVETDVPLKYLSNFWRNSDMLLINCEVHLILTWSADFVITSMEEREVTPT